MRRLSRTKIVISIIYHQIIFGKNNTNNKSPKQWFTEETIAQ